MHKQFLSGMIEGRQWGFLSEQTELAKAAGWNEMSGSFSHLEPELGLLFKLDMEH